MVWKKKKKDKQGADKCIGTFKRLYGTRYSKSKITYNIKIKHVT